MDSVLRSNTQTQTEVRPQLSPVKRLAFRLTSVVLSIFLLAAVGEVLLRVLPLGRYKSAPFRQYDPVLGLALIPNVKIVHSRGCFTGVVETNRWGFRDRDRTLEKPPGDYRIAMIGDSALEAPHVRPEQVENIRMEQLLQSQGHNNIEVMAFAIEGIGTTQEFLLYKDRVRQFHPDVVMLLFSNNDVFNNSSSLQNKIYGIHTWYSPYYDLSRDGNLVFRPVDSRPLNNTRTYLESHSYLFYYVERMWLKIDPTLYKWRGLPLDYEAYSEDPLDPEWTQAWTITEKVMAMMRDAVEADGAKFVLVIQPDNYVFDPQWREHMMQSAGTVPAEFKPEKFYERLQGISAMAGVTTFSVIPYMQAYSTEHHLQPPYFSLPCDPHYSALGQEVSAAALLDGLEKNHLIPPPAAK